MPGPWEKYQPQSQPGGFVLSPPDPAKQYETTSKLYDAQAAPAQARRTQTEADVAAATAAPTIRQKQAQATGAEIAPPMDLRKEFSSLPVVKDYTSVLPIYASALDASPGGAGDVNIIYGLAKILDPGSVVREGELQIAQSTGSVGEQLKGYFKRASQGGSLTPEVRKGLISEMNNRSSALAQQYNQQRLHYKRLAEMHGLDPSEVVGPHPAEPFQQAEADYKNRPIRNLDGGIGAVPSDFDLGQLPSTYVSDGMGGQQGLKVDVTDDRLPGETEEQYLVRARKGMDVPPDAPSTWQGIKQGVLHPIDRAAEGLQNTANKLFGTNFNSASEDNRQRERYFEQHPGTLGGRLLGEIPMLALATSRLGPGGGGALSNVLAGDSRNFEGIGKDAALGFVGGKIADTAIRGVAGAVAPRVDPKLQRLHAEGQTFTPGQILGGKVRQFEDAATSLPIVGPKATQARNIGIEKFNRVTYNRALQPLGTKVPDNIPAGHDAVKYVQDMISKGYDEALSGVQVQPDKALVARLRAVAHKAKLPGGEAAKLQEIFQREVAGAFEATGGRLSGTAWKMMDERLGKLATGYKGSQNPYERVLGDAVEETREQVAAMVRRQNPKVAGTMRKLDLAWAQFAKVRAAASNSVDGVFTPKQLRVAVRQGDKSVGKGATARGEALMQDLAVDGSVLPSKIADSGTPERLNQATGKAWALGAMASPLYSPGFLRSYEKFMLSQRPEVFDVAGRAIRSLPGAPGGFLLPQLPIFSSGQ